MMKRRQYYVALAVLAVTGLAGGVLGSWLFSRRTVMTVRELRVLDNNGLQVAELNGSGLRLWNAELDSEAMLRPTSFRLGSIPCGGSDEKSRTQLYPGQLYMQNDMRNGEQYSVALCYNTLYFSTGAEALIELSTSQPSAQTEKFETWPSIRLSDQAGTLRMILGMCETEHPRTKIIKKHPVSSILLLSETGPPIWQAP